MDFPAGEGSNGVVCKIHAYGDGNFRLAHLATAGTATRSEPAVQHRFLPDADVHTFCQGTSRNVPLPEANNCNDFNADKELGRTKQKFDISGEEDHVHIRHSWALVIHSFAACLHPSCDKHRTVTCLEKLRALSLFPGKSHTLMS